MEWIFTARRWFTETAYRNYILAVLNLASQYNVRICLMCAWDMAVESEWTDFETFVDAVKGYAATNSVGLDFEHCQNKGATYEEMLPNVDRAKAIVEGAGLPFINYYMWLGPEYTPRYMHIAHTNWPMAGDFEATLDDKTEPNYVGMSAGTYTGPTSPDGAIPFPENPPSSPYQRWNGGWNQESVNRVLDHGVGALGGAKPEGTRNFIIYCAGAVYNTNINPFEGVSGKLTGWVWDHPLWRQYISDRMLFHGLDKFALSITPRPPRKNKIGLDTFIRWLCSHTFRVSST